MPTTVNRHTTFNDYELNYPDVLICNVDDSGTKSLLSKLKALNDDPSPLKFTSPVYNPITSSELTIVHPQNSSTTGGFFGLTRSGGTKSHKGLDIAAEPNTSVLASEDGVVVYSGFAKGYGNVAYINHRGGYQTRYAHLNQLDVKVGDSVKQGEIIGLSGKTGNANEAGILAHVHFEVRQINDNTQTMGLSPSESTPLNPLDYLLQKPFYFEFNINLLQV